MTDNTLITITRNNRPGSVKLEDLRKYDVLSMTHLHRNVQYQGKNGVNYFFSLCGANASGANLKFREETLYVQDGALGSTQVSSAARDYGTHQALRDRLCS